MADCREGGIAPVVVEYTVVDRINVEQIPVRVEGAEAGYGVRVVRACGICGQTRGATSQPSAVSLLRVGPSLGQYGRETW